VFGLHDHSISNHPTDSCHRFHTLPLSVTGFQYGLGFANWQEARQTARPNRVHNRYGLVILLQWFPTPFHKDAVTFKYRPESVCLKRTRTSLTKHTYSHTATAGLFQQCDIRWALRRVAPKDSFGAAKP